MNTETDVQDPEQETTNLELSVDIDETSSCGRHVTVTIPREEIERYFAMQFDDLVPKAEVPGFRPGKAPRKLVEKKFRKQLTDRVKGQLIMDSLAQVNDGETFSAISEPDLDYEQVQIPEEGDFKYEFNIEVRPEFELPTYKGLKLTRPEHDFTDQDVDEYIQNMKLERTVLVPVDEPAQANDTVICRITTTLDGEPVAAIPEATLVVKPEIDFADATLEGFAELIIGAEADETRATKVEISKFAENEAVREKEVDVAFEILDVKRPEMISDEDLSEALGLPGDGDLREMVRTVLERQLQYSQRQTIRDQITAALTESASWDLPQELLDRQAKRELQRAVMEMQSSGFTQAQILARENALRKDIHERTAVLLKEHFVLERIAEEEEIEDSPGDYEAEIMRIAMQRNDSPRRVRARLERTGQMDALRNMIIESKVIDLITENATFEGTEYEDANQEDAEVFSSAEFVGGRKASIPEAKYEGGEAPAIPGLENDKK